MKSLQNRLNEFFNALSAPVLVTASAFSQARRHLKHTAFIELNQSAVVEPFYEEGEYQRYKGFRVVSIDGSKIRLPDEAEIEKEFGKMAITNGKDKTVIGYQAHSQASVLYDVLNEIPLDAALAPINAYEVTLAKGHLAQMKDKDLLLADRNYPSYEFLASLIQAGKDFVIRCSRKSFKKASEMLKGTGSGSQIVTLKPPNGKANHIRKSGLPTRIRVRFVRVLLSTGEFEVLVTSLLDEAEYPAEDFKEIYHWRWGAETFYGRIKTRLEVENFSGKTVESVRQDFYATLFICGLESILTQETRAELAERSEENRHVQKVNKAVSFNAIKDQIIELFYSDLESSVIMDTLKQLFLQNPTLVRNDRVTPRKKLSAQKKLSYCLYRKKHAY